MSKACALSFHLHTVYLASDSTVSCMGDRLFTGYAHLTCHCYSLISGLLLCLALHWQLYDFVLTDMIFMSLIIPSGPLPKTVVDFWRLIWQEHPPTIVMVTNLKEGSHTKCQQYWPENGKKDFGPFQVTIADQQVFADYTIRTLSVSVIIISYFESGYG